MLVNNFAGHFIKKKEEEFPKEEECGEKQPCPNQLAMSWGMHIILTLKIHLWGQHITLRWIYLQADEHNFVVEFTPKNELTNPLYEDDKKPQLLLQLAKVNERSTNGKLAYSRWMTHHRWDHCWLWLPRTYRLLLKLSQIGRGSVEDKTARIV